MAGGQRLTIHLSGGGPWGFRLYGGENDPLVIAKLRKRSKAADAGINEGDILLGINGFSCKGLNHPTAMALVEQAGNNLTFEVFRGSMDKHLVDTAFESLGSSLKPPAASQIPSQQTAPPAIETGHQIPQYGGTSLRQEPTEDQNENIINGHSEYDAPGVSRLCQMFQQGDTTKEITTETSKQQIGGTTITKVRREEITHSGVGPGLSPYPLHEQRGISPTRAPMFQVSNNITSVNKKPGVWAPTGQTSDVVNVPLKVNAPGGVNLSHNSDKSVTMPFGVGDDTSDSKENIAPKNQKPVPAFRLKKNTGAAPPGAWQPTSVPVLHEQAPPQQQQQELPESFTHFPFENPIWNAKGGMDVMDTSEPFVDETVMNIHLSKILHEGPGSDYDSGNESPGTFWRRKKKIFADSSFYDDPEHKYPTIEEQIKMARKVALSLIAPANKNARGHKMFLKRKQKAVKWTTGLPIGDHHYEIDFSEDEDEKYFIPNPWNKVHTWAPPSQQHHQPIDALPQPKPAAVVPQQPVYVPPPPPPPPPMENIWKPKVVSSFDSTDNDKNKSLSANEIESVRIHGQKTKHTSVPPQMAFSLADDLRKMKGKGGRLFAKRKERAEKWVVGESWGQADANPAIMEKIVLQHDVESGHHHIPRPKEKVVSENMTGGIPVNRLKQLIEPPKAKMSPWDACADFGDVDKAFDHLDGYLTIKQGKFKDVVASNLEKAAQRSYMTPFRPDAHGVPVNVSSSPSKIPDYTSKIKPWQSSESLSTYSYFSETTSTTSSVEPYISLHSARATPTDLHSLLSASSPHVNTAPLAVSQQPVISPASKPAMNDTKNDILSPKHPRGWNKLTGEGPDVGLYFAQPGEKNRPVPEPQVDLKPKSTSGSMSSSAGFRPVKFKKPSGLSQSQNAGVFDAGPRLWNKVPHQSQGPPSFMSGGVASSHSSQKDVSEEMGYCDL